MNSKLLPSCFSVRRSIGSKVLLSSSAQKRSKPWSRRSAQYSSAAMPTLVVACMTRGAILTAKAQQASSLCISVCNTT